VDATNLQKERGRRTLGRSQQKGGKERVGGEAGTTEKKLHTGFQGRRVGDAAGLIVQHRRSYKKRKGKAPIQPPGKGSCRSASGGKSGRPARKAKNLGGGL